MGTRSSQQTLVARSEALRGAADSVQQNEPSNQPNAGDEPMRFLYLANASNSESVKEVWRYPLCDICLLNVDYDDAGIASWLKCNGKIAEIALFERHGLSDPEYPILKLVGVYPVMDGWGFIDLDQVAGKGQDYRSPLYVVLGSECIRKSLIPCSNAPSEELYPANPGQLSKPTDQKQAGERTLGHEPLEWLYLADASPSYKRTMRFWFEDTYFINIDHSVAGVADWLGWKGIIAEIAIFEKRNPNDPQYPRLKPVGVYPVRNGRARIRLAEVAGIQQGYYSPLYITAGGPLMKLLGLGLQRRLHSLDFVKS